MTLVECPRERDVLDAVAAARWPDRLDQRLADHLDSCAICRDLAAVASVMSADSDVAWREAVIPSSGQAWWRAEMRARQEAIRSASRPLAVAQGVAALCLLALGVAAAWFAWTPARDYMWMVVRSPAPTFSSSPALPLLVALGALAVIAPVAVYLVITGD
jgi:hypothetical protein